MSVSWGMFWEVFVKTHVVRTEDVRTVEHSLLSVGRGHLFPPPKGVDLTNMRLRLAILLGPSVKKVKDVWCKKIKGVYVCGVGRIVSKRHSGVTVSTVRLIKLLRQKTGRVGVDEGGVLTGRSPVGVYPGVTIDEDTVKSGCK